MTPEYLNLRESCEYLGLAYSTMRKNGSWMEWERLGVVASRPGKRTLKFKRSELDRLMKETKVSR